MYANEIMLKKKKKLLLSSYISEEGYCSRNELITFLRNIMSIGFVFTPDVINKLSFHPTKNLKVLQDVIVPVLNEMVGNHVDHKVFYPNFPKQVMEASEAELFFNAMVHYFSFHLRDLTDGEFPTWFPKYEKEPRKTIDEYEDIEEFKVIDLGTFDEFYSIFTEIVGANSSISKFDKDVVEWFIRTFKEDIYFYIPNEIPYKENLALVVGLLYANNADLSILRKAISTPTDVLRIATVMSGGDVSLAENTKFKKFNRKERKWILFLLNNPAYNIEDMYRNRGRWLRLGEILHPGEYKKNYPHAFNFFNTLRNKDRIEKFNGKVDRLFKNGDLDNLLDLLTQRPGEFARRLDLLLRTFNDVNIISKFNKVIDKVSTPVILQLMGHFKNRNVDNDVRVFFPKGNVSKAFVKENDLTPIDSALTIKIEIICENELERRFSKLPDMSGQIVHLDPNLSDIKVPFGDRSASEGLVTYPRGSKFRIPEKNTMRFFIHWKNLNDKYDFDRVDLDLSCALFSDEWKKEGHISYTKLRDFKLRCCHSGDITDAPNGASEFIDININSLMDNNIRYLIPAIFSFTHQPFYKIPECFFGWMGREYPKSKEIYEPNKVNNKINLTSDQRISVPMIVDIFEDKIIWADLGISDGKILNNIESNNGGIIDLAKSVIYDEKPDIHKLLSLNFQSRNAEIVRNPEHADISFTVNNITEKMDEIKSEYMA
ncbi:MAG: TerD family protein [Candidatus Woesearchaeota archaeon]